MLLRVIEEKQSQFSKYTKIQKDKSKFHVEPKAHLNHLKSPLSKQTRIRNEKI